MSELNPKQYRQNGTVKVDVVQMLNDNTDAIVKWINRPGTIIHNTKTFKAVIITIEVPTHAGVQLLRYKDFLIRYSDNKGKTEFVVVSEDQFHKRYEPDSQQQSSGGIDGYRMNPWGY